LVLAGSHRHHSPDFAIARAAEGTCWKYAATAAIS
jgi:hypothetical protein